MRVVWLVFFFQAEDGIRDTSVTGVQTCALPILTCAEAMVFVVEIRALLSSRGERAFDENGLEVRVAAASTRIAVLTGALVLAGTGPGPGGEMPIGREAREIRADLREDFDGGNALDAVD